MYVHWLSVKFTSLGSVRSCDFSRTKQHIKEQVSHDVCWGMCLNFYVMLWNWMSSAILRDAWSVDTSDTDAMFSHRMIISVKPNKEGVLVHHEHFCFFTTSFKITSTPFPNTRNTCLPSSRALGSGSWAMILCFIQVLLVVVNNVQSCASFLSYNMVKLDNWNVTPSSPPLLFLTYYTSSVLLYNCGGVSLQVQWDPGGTLFISDGYWECAAPRDMFFTISV